MSTALCLAAALASAWLAWALGHLALMALMPTEVAPCYNGFRIIIPRWVEGILDADELAAVRLHEEGHAVCSHAWENFGMVCVFRRTTRQRRVEQELEADGYASERGGGPALARALRKMGRSPHDSVRARRLEMLEVSRICGQEEDDARRLRANQGEGKREP